MGVNDMAGISFRQPKSFDERFGVAEQCSARLDMKTPILVDDMKNTTCEKYAAFPDRLFIVDLDGKVAYKGGRGPFGYKPKELEQILLLIMMDAQMKEREAAEKKKQADAAKAQAKKIELEKKVASQKAAAKLEAMKKEAAKKAKDDAKKAGAKPKPKKSRPEPPGPDPKIESPKSKNPTRFI